MTDDDIKKLGVIIERENIDRAAQQEPGAKMIAGPELFDLAIMFVRGGIETDHPNATDEEIRELIRERLEMGRKLESNSLSYELFFSPLDSGDAA